MRLPQALRRAGVIAAVSVMVATTAQAAPSGVLFQTAPSDDETTFNGVSIIGPSDEELRVARNAIGAITDEIERAEAELALVADELDVVTQKLAIASEQFSVAEEASWQAAEAADVARDELARVQEELAEARADEAVNRAILTSFARDAYMFGPSQTDTTLMMLDGMSRNGDSDLIKAQQAVDVVARDRTKVLEDNEVLVAATAALEEEAAQMEQARAEKEAAAEAAREEAAHHHATVLELVDQTESKLARQEELVDELGLDRATAITTLDNLETEAQQAQAAAAAKRQAEEEARQRAQEAARRAQEAAAAERAAAERAAAEQAARDAEEAAAAQAAAQEAQEAQEAEVAAQPAPTQQAAQDRSAEEAAARDAERAAEAAAAQRAADEAKRADEAAQRAADAAAEAQAEAARAEERAKAEREAAAAVSVRPSGSMTTVGGITVSSSIAGQLEALLTDARADGIYLGGHGYRSPATTAALRIANGCPDVYTSPASSCRVPTARPGTSMHERGLAIDFTYKGSTICFPRRASNCHGNAGFDWLKANANKYGLYGLSSEAWHWSTNGH